MSPNDSRRRSQRLVTASMTTESDPPVIDVELNLSEPSNKAASSNETEIPLKRKHEEEKIELGVDPVEGPPTKSQKAYVKDEVHWFLDGNILLQISDTRFKVHRSRLSSESPWFEAFMEQRSGNIPDTPHVDQEEIDKALKDAEDMDGMDLIYLDFTDGPTATQFGALLTAMQCGIDYVYNSPTFDVMVDIYIASSFYRVTRYVKFGETFLKKTFPDTWDSIAPEPSLHAARGLKLGLDYAIHGILRHCFYDLARNHPLLPLEYVTEDNSPQAAIALNKDLMCIPVSEFIYLLNLQRHLSLTWDSLYVLMKIECGDCSTSHRATGALNLTKTKHPFDPILGIKKIIERVPTSKVYCAKTEKEVLKRLASQRDIIWKNMEEWINI